MICERYAAGFFDGEGSVYAAVRNRLYKNPTVLATIPNTVEEPLLLFQERWGGSICKRFQADARRKPQFQWVVAPRNARVFLRDIRPYLIIKAAVTDKALELLDLLALPASERMDYSQLRPSKTPGKMTRAGIMKPEFRKRIDAVHAEIRALNMRGAPRNARRSY